MMLVYSESAGTKAKKRARQADSSVCEVKKSTHEYENEIFKVSFPYFVRKLFSFLCGIQNAWHQ